MVLPNFLCVGTQKAGTTSLHNILIQHSNIYLPKKKETKFFVDDSLFEKGLSYYESEFFSKWNGEKAIGEVDPDYMYFEYVPERIYGFLGKDIKLIFFLRNPVERAYSHYLMSKGRGIEKLSFLEAVKVERERIHKDFFSKSHFSYITRGFYSEQIKRFLRFFPKENMFFAIFEKDFLNDRANLFKKLFNFLDVPEKKEIDFNIKSNPAFGSHVPLLSRIIHEKPKWAKSFANIFIPNKKIKRKIAVMLDEINKKPIKKRELNVNEKYFLYKTYFKKEIQELEKLINRDLSIWRKF